MVGVHENMVDSSTAAETKVTKEHKQMGRKPEKTRAQKDAHNARCQKSRLKAKRRREDLEAMVPELQAENKRMKAEIERLEAKQGIEFESHELRRALETGGAIVELLKQIPRAWKVDGKNFTSFEEMETWILSQTYDQGSGTKAGFPVASAAGSFFVAYPELASAFAAPYNPSTSDFFTHHDLAAAGFSLIAAHESPVMFDAPNNHDTINNLSTRDPAAGFPRASAAGSSSCDIGGLFPHDPAAENKAGFPKSHL